LSIESDKLSIEIPAQSESTREMRKPVSRGTRLRVATAKTARWLHIYLSMVSFAVILFFAATGLTLNHPTWFANQQKTDERHGVVTAELLRASGGEQADKLGIVEMLRSRERVHGAVSDFRVDDQQIAVSFKAPGYTADAFIDRATGKYDLTEVRSGFVAVVNDLHKGSETGAGWRLLIDASAMFLVLVSLTGLLLICFLYKRRSSGLILAAAGAGICLLVYRLLVP
jgi:hypothetical protein